MLSPTHGAIAIVLSLVLTLALTPVVRALARRLGAVAKPKSDRWHKRPTALMGGVAIFGAVALVHLTTVNGGPQTAVVLGASAFLFLVGLVDDFVQLKPYQKLIGQLMGAMPVIYCGMTLPWTGSPALDIGITLLWLVGITNAINLLDNMDGLAAGISMIAAIFLALNFSAHGHSVDALALAVFAAALLGFLVYNSYPATIFMGDCGSMFTGFFLASSALADPAAGRSRSFLPVIAVPVLILFIPIFDTLFVMILRKLAGRAASQGGRDHTSHRLVALGLSERRAVWMLYGFAVASGLLGLLVRDLALDVSIAAIVGFTLVLTFLGVHLAGVKVYDDAELKAAVEKPLVAFLVDLSYKRRVFEVLLDVVLIALSYYVSYALVFGPVAGGQVHQDFFQTLPVLVFIRIAAFLGMGVYRGIWRYVGLDNLLVFALAVLVGSVASVVAFLIAFPAQVFPRVVFVLDGLILMSLLTGSRVAFRLIRKALPVRNALEGEGRRVLIYGAGDAGELLLREMRNNRGLCYTPVGFADDDPLKTGKVIHGLRVYGGNGSLGRICKEHRVEEVLISSSRFADARVREILRACEQANVALKLMRIQIEGVRREVPESQGVECEIEHHDNS